MERYILTGAPGCGKTALLHELQSRGFHVVEEAATDVIAIRQARGIAEPWRDPLFVDAITELQRQRQIAASTTSDGIQFFDRSPFCTVALTRFLDFPQSPMLTSEIHRILAERVYQRRVFFVESLGFVEKSAARRITLEQAKRFAAIHAEVYREFGFELVTLPPASIECRADQLLSAALPI